mmetsp:Transcript_3506/g.8353  ORF Transcript_3506/g.8353 Transcript_3506/m.8353 type:complete len:112 (-) Transcript_3506:63-398(-)
MIPDTIEKASDATNVRNLSRGFSRDEEESSPPVVLKSLLNFTRGDDGADSPSLFDCANIRLLFVRIYMCADGNSETRLQVAVNGLDFTKPKTYVLVDTKVNAMRYTAKRNP